MPFKALCNGIPVISADFLAPDWLKEKNWARKGDVVYICPSCHESVTLATSHRDTQFFKHPRDTKCPNSQRESFEHERLKMAVYRLCKKLGWQTDIEAAGPDWQADVLATDETRKVAFEVQLSGITGEVLVERSEKYRRDGIIVVWLLKSFPKRCPLNVPVKNFTKFTWKPDFEYFVPSYVNSTNLTDYDIECYFRDRDHKRWSICETIVYWNELGAILATFDKDDPDHQMMKLRRDPATLISVVTQALDGTIASTFENSLSYSNSLYDKYEIEEREGGHVNYQEFLRAQTWLRAREEKAEQERIRINENARLLREKNEKARRLEEQRNAMYTLIWGK